MQAISWPLEILNRQGKDAEEIDDVERVTIKEYPKKANIFDLFKGDEVSNAAQLDLGKVQTFYFTLILVFAYGVQLGSLFLNSSGIVGELPVLSTGMLALLAVSQAGCFNTKPFRTESGAPVSRPPDLSVVLVLALVASVHGFRSYRPFG